MPLSVKAINSLKMLRQEIASEIPAEDLNRRAWVAVYPPLKQQLINVVPGRWRGDTYLVKKFEIPKELVDEYFGQDSVYNLQKEEATSIEEVEQILAQWGIDSSTLEAPWHSDYPL